MYFKLLLDLLTQDVDVELADSRSFGNEVILTPELEATVIELLEIDCLIVIDNLTLSLQVEMILGSSALLLLIFCDHRFELHLHQIADLTTINRFNTLE